MPEEEFEIAGDENFGNLDTPRRARMNLARGVSFRLLPISNHICIPTNMVTVISFTLLNSLYNHSSSLLQDPPLFSHLHVLLHGEFKAPSRDDLRDLILIGGGKIVTTLDDDGGGRTQVEVVCEGGLDEETRRRLGEETYAGRRLVSASWILDCVSQYDIVDVRPYWARQVPY